MDYKSGEFSTIYQGRYSNFREDNSMMEMTRTGLDKRELHNTERFIFKDN